MFLPKQSAFFYYFIIFLALPQLVIAGKTPNSFSLDSLIAESRKPNYAFATFEKSFRKIADKAPKQSPEVLDAIYKTILAEKYAKQEDAKNNKSTELFSEAVTIAERTNNIDLIAWVNTCSGFYHYSYAEMVEALPFFLKVSEILDKKLISLRIQTCEVYVKNAYYFGSIDDPLRAITYLQKALPYAEHDKKTEATIRYALGTFHLGENDLKQAEQFLIESRDLALEVNDEVRYAKCLGDLAIINEKKGHLALAESMLLEDIAISDRLKEGRNLMYAQIQLAKLYLRQDKVKEASEVVNKAYNYAESKTYLKGFEQEAVEIQLTIAQLENDSRSELDAFRKLNTLRPHVSSTDGKEVVDKINWKLQKQEVITQLEIEKTKLERASLIKLSWTVISALLLIVVVLLFFTYRRRLKLQAAEFESKILHFQMDKLNSEQKLKETNSSLNSFRVFLSERNAQIEVLERELATVTTSSKSSSKNHQGALSRLLESHLMTEDNWIRFKSAFQEEVPEYCQLVTESLPNLTESNLRIVLLSKMDLNNTQTAHILGITVDAVKKAKQRLKKKYGERVNEFI